MSARESIEPGTFHLLPQDILSWWTRAPTYLLSKLLLSPHRHARHFQQWMLDIFSKDSIQLIPSLCRQCAQLCCDSLPRQVFSQRGSKLFGKIIQNISFPQSETDAVPAICFFGAGMYLQIPMDKLYWLSVRLTSYVAIPHSSVTWYTIAPIFLIQNSIRLHHTRGSWFWNCD